MILTMVFFGGWLSRFELYAFGVLVWRRCLTMGGWVGLRVGFININDMSNNDVGKGVVYAYEAYEAK